MGQQGQRQSLSGTQSISLMDAVYAGTPICLIGSLDTVKSERANTSKAHLPHLPALRPIPNTRSPRRRSNPVDGRAISLDRRRRLRRPKRVRRAQKSTTVEFASLCRPLRARAAYHQRMKLRPGPLPRLKPGRQCHSEA